MSRQAQSMPFDDHTCCKLEVIAVDLLALVACRTAFPKELKAATDPGILDKRYAISQNA